jgi:hypothetical protein
MKKRLSKVIQLSSLHQVRDSINPVKGREYIIVANNRIGIVLKIYDLSVSEDGRQVKTRVPVNGKG